MTFLESASLDSEIIGVYVAKNGRTGMDVTLNLSSLLAKPSAANIAQSLELAYNRMPSSRMADFFKVPFKFSASTAPSQLKTEETNTILLGADFFSKSEIQFV